MGLVGEARVVVVLPRHVSPPSVSLLHTSLIDACSGYEEGVKDAHGKGVTPLFSQMVALHGQDASAVAQQLKRLGASVDDDGSLMGCQSASKIDPSKQRARWGE
ncbi:hypothetical protein CCR94_15875 [Rhodoblastus sphagnicola]|uniref:DUF2383 domain-containing protein n=1 Tax=Rhodoblastus sphagnicola TaxID=333368 RepID=A0A2S6N3W4_9HYPH|nr:DUF2383 domain-containing protein [Rhodoblastus sphagnicola]PPQ29296.1 hypothetical protein CCR94_15875 [Rhodoblastus sphagnicola]